MLLEFARADRAGDPHAFRFIPQEYLLRSAGGGFESAPLVWDEALLSDLAAIRSPSPDPELLARLGELLRRFLSPLGWAQHEQRILDACGRGERFVLTIRSAAAELYVLPWELLTLKATGQHLGELPSLLLRYEWPETTTAAEQPAPRPSGGRILFAWSAAGGAVPASEHLSAISSACTSGFHPFDPNRDVLPHASYRRLDEALRLAQREDAPIAVLHLLCHGASAGRTFGLALNEDDADGAPSIVDAGRLRQLLAPHAGMVRLVVLMACDSSNAGALGNQLGSVAQALHRAGIAAVVASRYPLSARGSVQLTQTLYERLLFGLDSLESAFLCARRELAQKRKGLDWAGVQIYSRSADGEDTRPLVFRPYRGLAAFHPSDRRFYFGRERDIERIVKLLSGGSRLVTLVGASGVGKSSLILAGVVPVLEHRAELAGRLRVHVVRPGATPCLALAQVLTAGSGPPREISSAELRRGLLSRRETLAEHAASARDTKLLLVVDQAEELFSQSDRAEAAAFIDNLLYAISVADGQAAVVLTLRADFLGLCLDQSALAEHVRTTLELILPLNPAELRQAILLPALQVGLQFEEGLVDALLDALSDTGGAEAKEGGKEGGAGSVSSPDSTLAASSGGNLPLLQFTLEQLWEHRTGDTITWHAWRSIGGVRGAITRRANEVLELSRKTDEPGLVQRLFERLVQLGEGTVDTRRRAQRDEIEQIAPGRMNRVLNRWVDSRLLTADESEVSIAHEALLYEWETLRRWIDDGRESLRVLQRLSRDARHYSAAGESADDLWHGTPLRHALKLQAEGKLPLSKEEAAFLQRSAQAAEQHQVLIKEQLRRTRDNDRNLGGKTRAAAVLSLILFGGAGHAFARLYLKHVTHYLFLYLTVGITALGLLIMTMLRKSSIDNEFNRRALLVSLSAPGPIFMNHVVGSVFGFPVDESTVLDLNIVLMVMITATLLIDSHLWPTIVLNVIGIVLGMLRPDWLGPIMAIFPSLSILCAVVVFRRHTARRTPPQSTPSG